MDLRFLLGGADVAGDVEVVAFLAIRSIDDALGVTLLLLPVLVGLDDLVDVLVESVGSGVCLSRSARRR